MNSSSSKNVIDQLCFKIIYFIYMYKNDLALNVLQVLICHKIKPNQTNVKYILVVNMDYLLFDNPSYKSCTFPLVK